MKMETSLHRIIEDSPQVSLMLDLLSGDSISSLSDNIICPAIEEIILLAYSITGQTKYTDLTVRASAVELTNKFKRDHPMLTLKSIRFAIKNGAYGHYNDPDGQVYFTLQNASKWVRKFCETERQDALKIRHQLIQQKEAKIELTEAEKEKIMQDGYNAAIEDFKKNGSYNDLGNAVYDWCVKRGIIHGDKYLEFRNTILNDIEDSHKAAKQDPKSRKEWEDLMFDIQTGHSNAIEVRAKKMAINDHFRIITQPD